MSGETTRIDRRVRPGQRIEIGVSLISPSAEGNYTGNWTLRSNNREFGDRLRVRIIVDADVHGKVFDFAERYCTASWGSNSRALPCPGSVGNRAGFVVRVNQPRLENGQQSVPALWTHPALTHNPWIKGIFPALIIQSGDRFLADVGCLYGYEDCDVTFRLLYQITGGSGENQLGEWVEVYDGVTTHIDLSLNALAGQYVSFRFLVLGQGPANQNAAFWFQPQIWRP
jgi:hypothetical protein